MKLSIAAVLLVLGFFWTGCGDSHKGHDHDHGHAHGDPGASSKGGHVHTAPHGGVLVELGNHEFNVEFLRDAAQGKLTLYVLDAHAENFVRLPLPSVDVTVGGEKLSLLAVANSGTGETVGNTSQFEVVADSLKKAGPLSGEIPHLDVKGKGYHGVKFQLP